MTIWTGAPALQPLLRPVGELRTNERNPRQGEVSEIAGSLQRFGQVRAILAREDGEIVAGNHTYLAAVSLDWTHVAVVTHDFATAEEARDYLLADNRLGDLGEYDQAELRVFLEELEQHGRWDGTGYKTDDLGDMRKLDALAAVPPPVRDPVAPPPELVERTLLFTEEQYAELGQHLRILRKEYGLEGVTETILRAVHAEAERSVT